jgi:uncharacterized protein
MRIAISVEHPAWVHNFKSILQTLIARGDDVLVLAIDKDRSFELLDSTGIPYVKAGRTTGANMVQKGFLFFWQSLNYTVRCMRFKPDILIGRASPMMAIAAWVTRRPHLIYEDTEVSKFSLRICRKLSAKILTPRTFLTDLGKAQQRVDTYKELFYLHPNVFTPDRNVLKAAGFHPDEPYVLMRFVAWNASHDVGKKGLNDADKLKLIRRMEAAGVRVWVSSEKPLAGELEAYRLKTPYALVHHVLAFARLVYSEGATMASEAAVLGTHALYVNEIQSGTTQEQQNRFDLLYCFHGPDRYERASEKALALLAVPDLKRQGQAKRERMLREKSDINGLFIAQIDQLGKAGK